MNRVACLLVGVGAVTLVGCFNFEPATRRPEPNTVEKLEMASVKNPSAVGNLILAGQPTQPGLAELKDDGVKLVVDLRGEGEVEWDEPKTVRDLGMEYRRVAFKAPDTLTDDIFDRVRLILRERSKDKTLLHCGSANRVGAVWLPYRVLDQAVPWEVAVEEARAVGLRTPEYEAAAKAYIDSRK